MNTTTLPASGAPNAVPVRIAYRPPTRVETTDAQVQTLLKIATTLSHALGGGTMMAAFDGTQPETTELPGESKAATEVAYWATLDAINRITTDTGRWEINQEETIEHTTVKMVKAEIQVKEEQYKAMILQQRPSTYLRPLTRQVTSTLWVCVHGDVVGQGTTPAEAMASFDLVMLQGAEMEDKEPTDAELQEIENPKKPKRRRKKS
jgi:hypothetical protein